MRSPKRAAGKAGLHFKNGVLLVASIIFSVVAAEAAVRFIDGYGMTSWPLSEPAAANDAKGDVMDGARAHLAAHQFWSTEKVHK